MNSHWKLDNEYGTKDFWKRVVRADKLDTVLPIADRRWAECLALLAANDEECATCQWYV